MKTENSTLRKKLKQYSALAGSVLATAGFANAQVIYTDVDPDFEFDAVTPFPGDFLGIDMNNDGTFDFVFQAFHGSSYNGIAFIPYPAYTSNPNAIAGTLGSLSGYPFGYVKAFELNNVIDNNLPFFGMADLSSGSGFYAPVMFSGSPGSAIGNWVGGVTDHYIGLRFSDGSNNHYGWIRCDVATDGSYIIIKDFAYDDTPDEGLFAGQGSPLVVTPIDQNRNFNIFGYEGVANVFVNDGNLDGATITVINMLGETVVSQALTDRATRLDLNQFSKGIYLVTVQRGSEIFSKKISFR